MNVINSIKYWLLDLIYGLLVVVSVLAQKTNAPITWRINLTIARAAIVSKQIDYLIEAENR